MRAGLPSNLHVEVALDRGRLSSDSTRSPITHVAANPHERVQSLHGDVEYMSSPGPRYTPQHSAITEEEEGAGMLSAAELAAALDQEEDDIAAQTNVMHDAKWYEDVSYPSPPLGALGSDPFLPGLQRSPTRSEPGHFSQMQGRPGQHGQAFAPRQGSLNPSSNAKPYPGIGVYAGVGAHSKPILMNHVNNYPAASLQGQGRPSLASPPPRSSSVPSPHASLDARTMSPPYAHASGTFTAPPTPTSQYPGGFVGLYQADPPNSAPILAREQDYASQPMPETQAFADRPRFTLTDDGPSSIPPDAHPGIRRAVSDSNFHSSHSHSGADEESESWLSDGLTPPMRRAGRGPASPSKYNTFEDMGIQGKSQAQAQAEKDKDCVIM